MGGPLVAPLRPSFPP
ncbi:hypothetical protein E2C01_070701 [Portunus trituberculatus]|uniref:Uncharacterized protein n=1 Tax=Portunus trituberculatus TaxID=210409 RepID=A0A5B7HY07_PORTR|nr:hypothetical protein [Portunus trituberculatus]